MAKNGYSTQKKNRILECLKNNSHVGMTVKDIEGYLINEYDLSVNITTIYRNLDKLLNEGIIIKHIVESGDKATYQYAMPEHECHNHLHLKCSSCGQVYHMDCDFMDEVKEHIYSHHGFTIECKTSMLYGTCDKCSSQNFDNNNRF